MRTVLAVAMCFMAGACDPLGDWDWQSEPLDFRYGSYVLTEPDTEGPIVLWEGADGSKFQIVNAELFCTQGGLNMSGSHDRVDWELLGPDGTIEQSGRWGMGFGVYCYLNGSMGLRFEYILPTYEISTQNEVMVEGCLQFRKQLPPKWAWRQEEIPLGQGEVFDRRYLPALMPVVTYRAREPCEQPPSNSPQ